MELVRQSSIRKLTDEEMDILASRLCWRDEAAERQALEELGICATERSIPIERELESDPDES